MFNFPYLVELLTPKRSAGDQTAVLLDRFADRFRQVIDAGGGVSIPDNPMGQPRWGALEAIELKNLTIDPEKVVMNLNTFHTKAELDGLLSRAAAAGLTYILAVRGDGGPLLPKLDAKSIGGRKSVATSIDLIRYIHTAYSEHFVIGAAFNPYKPMSFELNRMKQKVDAGAAYVVTQPVIGRDESVDRLHDLGIPVVVEAWMSTNIELLLKSVGKKADDSVAGYDPVDNLTVLHQAYPESCIYLSMLSFKQDWRQILPKLQNPSQDA